MFWLVLMSFHVLRRSCYSGSMLKLSKIYTICNWGINSLKDKDSTSEKEKQSLLISGVFSYLRLDLVVTVSHSHALSYECEIYSN